MIFTGKNLAMVHKGIDLAIAETHNQMAICPDVRRFVAELEALDADRREFEALLARIDKAIEKEKT